LRASAPAPPGFSARIVGGVDVRAGGADAFNLLNRTSLKSIHNSVGSLRLADPPRPIAGRRSMPTAPLSFPSALDARQFQFGLQIKF